MAMFRLWRIIFLIFDPDRSCYILQVFNIQKCFVMYIVIKINKKKRKEGTLTGEYEVR